MAQGRPINNYFDRRYKNNPYIRSKSQYPKRMYRPNQLTKEDVIYGKNIPTEEEFDRLMKEARQKQSILSNGTAPINNQPNDNGGDNHLQGMELSQRHRYGDELDILRSTFRKSKADIEKEKFKLIVACRKLLGKIFWVLRTVPKTERFVLGSQMRECGYTLLRNSVAIKKRYYRKNLLEVMDIELDVLRELARHASVQYPDWMPDGVLRNFLEEINCVGSICCGLLKSTVC